MVSKKRIIRRQKQPAATIFLFESNCMGLYLPRTVASCREFAQKSQKLFYSPLHVSTSIVVNIYIVISVIMRTVQTQSFKLYFVTLFRGAVQRGAAVCQLFMMSPRSSGRKMVAIAERKWVLYLLPPPSYLAFYINLCNLQLFFSKWRP